jgi:hypothetical protein
MGRHAPITADASERSLAPLVEHCRNVTKHHLATRRDGDGEVAVLILRQIIAQLIAILAGEALAPCKDALHGR